MQQFLRDVAGCCSVRERYDDAIIAVGLSRQNRN